MHPTDMDQQDQRDALAALAYSEGRRAGLMRLSPNLNPYPDPNDPLHQEWERARFSALGGSLRRTA